MEYLMNLQLLAEGAAPAAPAEGALATPGENEAEAPAAEDREAEFARMIKGDYKDLYDKMDKDENFKVRVLDWLSEVLYDRFENEAFGNFMAEELYAPDILEEE